jgi:hypothetical protein
MALTRLLIAFAAVLGLLLIWRELERRALTPAASPAGIPALLIESALLTLFAGLWFGSLGSGGAVLLFLVVGALMEVPVRLRSWPAGTLLWKPILIGILRVVLAGILLSVVLG